MILICKYYDRYVRFLFFIKYMLFFYVCVCDYVCMCEKKLPPVHPTRNAPLHLADTFATKAHPKQEF